MKRFFIALMVEHNMIDGASFLHWKFTLGLALALALYGAIGWFISLLSEQPHEEPRSLPYGKDDAPGELERGEGMQGRIRAY